MRGLLEVRRRAQVDRLLEWIGDGGRPPVRRVALVAPLLALAAIGIAVAVLTGGGGGENASAEETGAPTEPVERRDLAQRASVDGTLGYAGSAEVITRMAGTITWLPGAGSVIGRGDRLLEVDGEPVLLMYGSVPAYRDLASGVSDGPDVRELERNLFELGHDPGEVDDSFTSTTAAAVADWQDELGLEETGAVELGRVVFLPGERRVSSLDVALGSDTTSGAGASGAAASYDGSATPTVFASLTTIADTGADQGPKPKKKEKPSRKPSGGSKPSAGSGSGGETTGSGEPARTADPSAAGAADPTAAQGSGAAADESAPATQVMTTTSTRRVVTVALETGDLALAKRGRQARITFPSGETTRGRISSVGTVAESSSEESDPAATEDSSSESTVDVTIAITGKAKVPNLEDAPVTVELVEELRRDVLAVPVAALVGTAGGEYAVVVSDSEGRRQLPVEVGLFADGYVEVEGDGLSEGMEVEVPEGL